MSITKYSRHAPYPARIIERYLLTGASSTKRTHHISLEIDAFEFSFKPGDSVAVLPENDPEEVFRILKICGATGKEEILDPKTNTSISLHDYLLRKANIRRIDTGFIKALSPENESIDPDLFSKNAHSLLDLLALHPIKNVSLFTKLMPLLPRLYSIANSASFSPNEIHIAIAYASYLVNGQVRIGVASRFLCDLAHIHETPIPIYIQPSRHFLLPSDPAASIILIGPGTGIAPFRAFLQERLALQAPGKNWLFFGERNRVSDFYYETFWTDLEKQGRLRLDLAFSRDTPKPIYVQHKMYEQRKSLWSWLQEGAYLYLCGDAQSMAKDVDLMLLRIVHEEGHLSEEDARIYLKRLRSAKRYLIDIY